MRHVVRIGAALAIVAVAARAHAATPCAELVAAHLPHAQVTSAADAPAGGFTACKIDVVAAPTADSAIGIEVWIPEGAAWNGRYLQLGNGGFAGAIFSQRLAALAGQGYAVAMTDDGHKAQGLNPDASWAIGHPEKVRDFGWRALKETTVDARALIAALQGARPKYAYFDGCSDGGREALMEAQRFPYDFDGVVAGAPAYNFSGLLTLGAYDMQALNAPGAWLGPPQLKALEAAALADCGGSAFITEPVACRFDPDDAACASGVRPPACLSPAQVEAARAVYRGITVTGGGDARLAYPGYSPGGEAEPGGWSAWLTGSSRDQRDLALIHGFATGFWGGFVYGDPNFNVLALDLQRAPVDAARVAAEVNALDPDLAPFRDHGGKLIQFHGWNDPAIPARGSIAYAEAVHALLGDTSGFYRLYLVPGMLHCGGGPGPSGVDWLATLRAWVEDGKAPGDLVAHAPSGATQTLRPWTP
jgi:feruloyl esterase